MSNLWDNWPVLPWQSWQGVSVRAREESIVDLFAQVDEGTQVAVVNQIGWWRVGTLYKNKQDLQTAIFVSVGKANAANFAYRFRHAEKLKAPVTIVVGAPVYGFNPTTTVVKPRHISDFPHKCNLCGQAAVHLFNSIACSSYSCKNFPY